MKKLIMILSCMALVLVFSTYAMAGKGGVKGSNNNVVCTTIQDGVLTYSFGHCLYGQPIPTGYDPYGSNYQAHMFNGTYANNYLGREDKGSCLPPYDGDTDAYLAENPDAETKWYWPYRDVELMMKWNDAWLSNKDCDGDGKLDRFYGHDSYIGSGAWTTNHQSGTYMVDGNECKWVYFVKIVAVPADAELIGGIGDPPTPLIWYAADGTEIGPSIWGSFAIIQSIYNDPCDGAHGVEYLSPVGPGFGKFKP